MKKLSFLSVFTLIFLGCASHPKIIKIPCPERPALQPVEVKNGELDKTQTKHVLENWQRIWEYIHRIEKLGCTR